MDSSNIMLKSVQNIYPECHITTHAEAYAQLKTTFGVQSEILIQQDQKIERNLRLGIETETIFGA